MTIREMLDKVQHRDGWEDALTNEWVERMRALKRRLESAALDSPEEARDIANQIQGFKQAIDVSLFSVISPPEDPEVVDPEPFKDDGY